MINILNFAVVAQNVAPQQNQNASFLIMLIFVFILTYFLFLRPQKKREQENEKIRANIDIGDEIITVGGIIGTVVSLKDDFLVIETSGDRNKIRVTRWSVQSNNTADERNAKENESKKIMKKSN